jgi:exoribonuclease-2
VGYTPVPGSIVTVWEGGELALAVVAGEEKRRLKLIVAGGREIRVQPSRVGWVVEERGPVPGSTVEQRREAGRRVEQLELEVATLIEQTDVSVLWEIVVESVEGAEGASTSGGFFTAELAELALDDRSGTSMTAVARALREDGIHFARKGDDWVARSREQVEELEQQRQRVLAREGQTAAFFDALGGAVRGGDFVASGSEYEERYLDALYQLAVHEEDASEGARVMAVDALGASKLRHDRPHEGAFRLMRLVGRIEDDDVNLQVLRYGLRVEFPDEVRACAERSAGQVLASEGREDLSHLEILSIDSPSTREIDDALSLERIGDGFRLGVHIADPGALVKPDDAVDREALARGQTHYHPDLKLPMLPPALGEDAASLVAGKPRPALSFFFELDPATAAVRDRRVVRSIVRSTARLDYESVDRTIENGDGPHFATLVALARLGALRERSRIDQGAVSIYAPEIDFRVDGDGRIELDRIDPESASRRMVTEAMILAGESAAQICLEAGLPSVYRRQAAPDRPLELPAGGARGPVEVRRVRRSLNRGTVSSQPGSHFGLGVEAYVQITSPLRRFQDLAMHRQLAAHLSGQRPPYDAEAMQRIAATTERADRDARRAERGAEEFWRLRYLEGRTGQEVDAVVVETQPRTVIQLLETLHQQPMPALTGVELGGIVRLCIEHVNPRAGRLILRQVACSQER